MWFTNILTYLLVGVRTKVHLVQVEARISSLFSTPPLLFCQCIVFLVNSVFSRFVSCITPSVNVDLLDRICTLSSSYFSLFSYCSSKFCIRAWVHLISKPCLFLASTIIESRKFWLFEGLWLIHLNSNNILSYNKAFVAFSNALFLLFTS